MTTPYPLRETFTFSTGHRIVFKIDGTLWPPIIEWEPDAPPEDVFLREFGPQAIRALQKAANHFDDLILYPVPTPNGEVFHFFEPQPKPASK